MVGSKPVDHPVSKRQNKRKGQSHVLGDIVFAKKTVHISQMSKEKVEIRSKDFEKTGDKNNRQKRDTPMI